MTLSPRTTSPTHCPQQAPLFSRSGDISNPTRAFICVVRVVAISIACTVGWSYVDTALLLGYDDLIDPAIWVFVFYTPFLVVSIILFRDAVSSIFPSYAPKKEVSRVSLLYSVGGGYVHRVSLGCIRHEVWAI